MILNGKIAGMDSRRLWILRLACWLAGAQLRVWKARPRRVKDADANDPGIN